MNKKSAYSFLRYAVLTLIALLLLAPLLWVMISSLRPSDEIFQHSGQFSWRTLLPEQFTLAHYQSVLRSDLPIAVRNSLFVATMTVLLGVFVNSLAGFAFAVFKFPGKRLLFVMVLVSFMMPFEAIVIPLYVFMRTLGWTDSFRVLILPEVANGLVILLFRQFFAALPREILEAARCEGASWWQIYRHIAMPLSGPTIAAAALMLFILQWDAFFWPLIAASAPDYELIQVSIVRSITQEDTSWGTLFASSSIAVLIALFPFLLLQRFYVRSMISMST